MRKMTLLLAFCSCLAFSLSSAMAEEGKEPPAKEAGRQSNLSQGSLSAHNLPSVTIYGVADQPPAVSVTTSFGTQFNVVTEEQIALQNSLDFYDALRNVPGVMYQKKNIIGGQTSSSLYMRGRGASHPSPDLTILFDDVPRSGVLYGQALADGIPVYALGGMEIYKYPQPSRFGSGYGMINFVPKYMVEEGQEFRIGLQGGSYGTFAENVGMGAKKDAFDIYAAQSWVRTDGHVAHSSASQESYYLNTGFQMNENWNLRLMANAVEASTDAPLNPINGSNKYPRSFDTETSLVTLTLSHEYEKASGYLKGYYNTTNFYLNDETSGKTEGGADSKQSNDLYGLRVRETLWLWEGSEIVAGFDLDKMELENRQSFKNGSPTIKWDFPNVTVFSPYIAISQMFGDKASFHLSPSVGLRYYNNNTFDDKAAPQAGLVLGYADTNLNFNYARGVNYPSPVVLQNFLGNKSLPSGFDTEKIKPELVDHYEIGLTQTWPGFASLSGTFFYDKGKDRLRAYMYGAGPDESFFNASTPRYTIRGMELSGSLTPVENLNFFAGATWLRAKASGDDGQEQDKMPYTPDFAFQAGFKWRFLEDFQLSGDYQYLRNVYGATSMRTANPAKPGSNFPELSEADKLPSINVVNLRLDYFFNYEPLHIKEGKVFVAIDNVLDKDYAYALEKSGTRTGYYYMPGRTVMAGVELKF